MKEVGVDFVALFWTGLYAPAATPKAVIERLTVAAKKAMRDPAVVKRLAVLGTEAVGSTPAELDTETRAQFALYTRIVRDNPSLLGQ